MPLDDSLIYLQPVYLQSTAVGVPGVPADRRRVAAPGRLGRDRSARRSAAARSRKAGAPDPARAEPPTPDADARARARQPDAPARRRPSPAGRRRCRPTSPGLIDYANLHFELAQAALRDGDFARYGEEIALVEAALQRLDELAPGSASAPEPSASPAP